ncbi:hypothetical protein WMF18_33015 [Sorangium sp. So ce315]|uniref:hypothetical protein n=1 Tax=Sorangium sp. So ce315 TaxID=3133299 RepID=UPI003F610123
MADIDTVDGWDTSGNHTSSRSRDEVIAIVAEIPSLTLSYDHSNGAIATRIQMNMPIRITKGIHDDSRGKHITITANNDRTWHLYLKKDDYRGNTFIWRVDEIR